MADDVGGDIASPNYPSSYPNNQQCSWIIVAEEPCAWETSYLFLKSMFSFYNISIYAFISSISS